jgi:S-adenosylmethionine hydrolase
LSAGAGRRSASVFFLSDYGLRDEFVGVVHAVIRRLAPEVCVVDLTHGVEPFDVGAGAEALCRAAPYLGEGVVLAVVDPGVGGARRALALRAAATGGPDWLVGPDNGLLLPAAEVLGGVQRAFSLRREDRRVDGAAGGPTFDGRDVFAPAAAALASGIDPEDLGTPVEVSGLVRPVPPRLVRRAGAVNEILTEVTWVDAFGNLQLAVPSADLDPGVGALSVTLGAPGQGLGSLRRVRAFGDLAPGELGLLADSNGRLAVVLARASAALHLGAERGTPVRLTW